MYSAGFIGHFGQWNLNQNAAATWADSLLTYTSTNGPNHLLHLSVNLYFYILSISWLIMEFIMFSNSLCGFVGHMYERVWDNKAHYTQKFEYKKVGVFHIIEIHNIIIDYQSN